MRLRWPLFLGGLEYFFSKMGLRIACRLLKGMRLYRRSRLICGNREYKEWALGLRLYTGIYTYGLVFLGSDSG